MVTEHVLSYDHSIVPQEQFWDCAPGSTQVVLNGRGIIDAESDLIPIIGTTENGTDDIGWVLRALNPALPDAGYQVAYMPNDPPTQADKDALWSAIVGSVDAGYGLVANIVAPPSNYPRGVKGSVSPSYSGGTVFHYIAPMGYDDDPALRAVWIADPGFRPFGYWISFDQLATLIPPKGYAYATAPVPAPSPVPAPAPSPAPQSDPLAAATKALYDAVPIIDMDRAAQLVQPVMAGLAAAQCNTVKRIAMYLAQCGEESAGFNTTEEYAKGGPYAPYIGRTWIQITWQYNYAAFGQWCVQQGLLGDPDYFVNDPAALADVKWAGLGPAWYWTVARPTINSLCDRGDVVGVTQLINGGQNGIDDRQARYQQAIALGDELLALVAPPANPGGNPFMALTDQQQADLYNAIMGIAAVVVDNQTQLRGPGQQGWAQLGQNDQGQNLSIVDALAAVKSAVETNGKAT